MQTAEITSRTNWMKVVQKHLEAEQAATIVKSIAWYFVWPVVFFIILAPGFLISLPPAIDCDDGIRKPIAPERTTPANVFVHAAIFLVLIVFTYWFGATKLGIIFPFTAKATKQIMELPKMP